MARSWRTVFRRSNSQTAMDTNQPRSERRTNTVQRNTTTNERLSPEASMHTPGRRNTDDSRARSRRSSSKEPPNVESPVSSTDYARPRPEDIDATIADHYKAYLPVLSGEDASDNKLYMSLGGDKRLMQGVSEMKHSEDIADRNIAHHSGTSSRHSSLLTSTRTGLPSTTADPNTLNMHDSLRKGSTGGYSIASVTTPGSIDSTLSNAAKYTLGTGIATEGSLVDGIKPHVDGSKACTFNRADWPNRIARNELHLNWRRRKPRGSSDDDLTHLSRESTNGSDSTGEEKPPSPRGGFAGVRKAVMDGQYDGTNGGRPDLEGIVDLRNTVDVDRTTRWAPAVTHEVIQPTAHHIREERVYREIHNHDVYHYVQPVYETKILPARHFVPGPNKELVEVSEDQLPHSTGEHKRWLIAKKEDAKEMPQSTDRLTEPKVIADKRYMTPEGYERRETTILHPPELEDMSGYTGPVLPIHFVGTGTSAPESETRREVREVKRKPVDTGSVATERSRGPSSSREHPLPFPQSSALTCSSLSPAS